MDFSPEVLHKLWAVEMDILDVIDCVCREHELKYSIAYGTMLGAVRHHGFIPWDDDIDIIMPINDYNSLLSIWNEVAPSGYVLMNNKTNPEFSQSFTKIRKDHTTFVQTESQRFTSYHKGIYVDIFPAYRVAPGKVSRRLQIAAAAINLLYSRGHTSRTGPVHTFVERVLLAFPKSFKVKSLAFTERYMQKWSSQEDCMFFMPSTIRNVYRIYPDTLFDDMQDISFEDRKYMCIKDTDLFLRTVYRDYMTFPPEENRVWKHHPIILDFDHNLDELP